MRNVAFHISSSTMIMALVLAYAGPSAADDAAKARTFFEEGLNDMQAGHYKTGCKALAESLRLDRRLGTLFTLATCEKRWGRAAMASARFEEYLRAYEKLPRDQRALQSERFKVATAEVRELEKLVARLKLILPPNAPAGTIVRRNEEIVDTTWFGIDVPVEPGEHVISMQLPGEAATEQRILLEKGERKTIPLVVRNSSSRRRIAGFVTLEVVGALGIATAVVTGSLYMVKRNDRPVESELDGLRIATIIGAAAGGVGVALGITLIATSVESKPVRAGFLSVSPSGAVIGVRGEF